jgi:hypothetical protein
MRFPDGYVIPPPPLDIYNPHLDDEASALGSEASAGGGPPSNPNEMDELQLRVQLWDSYRLARIILGRSISCFTLKKRTILNAIQIVAEMKVEIIHLNTELEVARHRITPSLSSSEAGDTKELLDKIQSLKEQLVLKETQYETLFLQHEEFVKDTRSQLEDSFSQLQTLPKFNNSGDAAVDDNTKVQEMIQANLQRVIQTVALETSKPQIEELHDQLAASQEQTKRKQQEILELQLQIESVRKVGELEAGSTTAKHEQQMLDLTGMLEAYKTQVDRQQEQLVHYQKRVDGLEGGAVCVDPEEIHSLWNRVKDTSQDATEEETQEVNAQVKDLLERLATSNPTVEQQQELQLAAAAKRELESDEELRHFKLQQEMLNQETAIPPEAFEKILQSDKVVFEKQIAECLLREQQKGQELKTLDLKLTELAFMAVRIEDLQKEILHNQNTVYKPQKEAAEQRSKSHSAQVEMIRNTLNEVMAEQKESIQIIVKRSMQTSSSKADDDASPQSLHAAPQDDDEVEIASMAKELDAVARLEKLERVLASRDEELRQARERLTQSQQRITELEYEVMREDDKEGETASTESSGSHKHVALYKPPSSEVRFSSK